MTDFLLFARLNLPNVLIRMAKKLDSDFPSACFDVPKTWNVQNRKTNNRRLGMIVASCRDLKVRKKQISPTFSHFLINNALLYHCLANWLAHNKKMTWEICFSRSLKSSNVTEQRDQSNFGIVNIYVCCEEKGHYRVVSIVQLRFDRRSYCGCSRRMQGARTVTVKIIEIDGLPNFVRYGAPLARLRYVGTPPLM